MKNFLNKKDTGVPVSFSKQNCNLNIFIRCFESVFVMSMQQFMSFMTVRFFEPFFVKFLNGRIIM